MQVAEEVAAARQQQDPPQAVKAERAADQRQATAMKPDPLRPLAGMRPPEMVPAGSRGDRSLALGTCAA